MAQAATTAVSELSVTVIAMCAIGAATLALGAWRTRKEWAAARGLDRVATLANVSYAASLAVFGATHLFDPQSLLVRVPSYMPWRTAWVYLVGSALIATALSLAARVAVRWSGLLFGCMMFLFVGMLHLPGAIAVGDNRVLWTVVVRELSFGGGAWILAALAAEGWSERRRDGLITAGRIFVTLALLFFGVEHFRHPAGLPGVPLEQEMPVGLPGRLWIGYMTGALQLLAVASVLWSRRGRQVVLWVGVWLLLLVVALYGPLMIQALRGPGETAQVVAIDFFVDTLLFAGAVLALAKATPDDREKRF